MIEIFAWVAGAVIAFGLAGIVMLWIGFLMMLVGNYLCDEDGMPMLAPEDDDE